MIDAGMSLPIKSENLFGCSFLIKTYKGLFIEQIVEDGPADQADYRQEDGFSMIRKLKLSAM